MGGAEQARPFREHSADGAAIAYTGNTDALLSEINPGNTASGILIFDIPVDATPAYLELHATIFSAGTRVALG